MEGTDGILVKITLIIIIVDDFKKFWLFLAFVSVKFKKYNFLYFNNAYQSTFEVKYVIIIKRMIKKSFLSE